MQAKASAPIASCAGFHAHGSLAAAAAAHANRCGLPWHSVRSCLLPFCCKPRTCHAILIIGGKGSLTEPGGDFVAALCLPERISGHSLLSNLMCYSCIGSDCHRLTV